MQYSSILKFDSLTKRLTLSYALAFSWLLGAVFISLLWFVGTALDARIQEDLTEDVDEFSGYLAKHGTTGVIEEMEKEAAGPERETTLLQLYRSNGSLVHSTDREYWGSWSIEQNQVLERTAALDDVAYESISVPQLESDARVVIGALSHEFVLVIAESNDERDEIMELLSIAFLTVFLLTVPLLAFLVWLLTRRSLVGIKKVSEAAMEIKAGNLDRRVGVRGQATEVQTLADTFDAMADRIQALIRNMREMTDNIAHDLRSPLGRVRLLSESVLHTITNDNDYRIAAENTVAECDRLIKMINTSLDVAETEAGVTIRPHEQFDMAELVRDACELFEPMAEELGINLEHAVEGSVQFEGDLTALQRMLGNVLDNATKFTSSGGVVSVSLAQDRDLLEVTVRDSGIGIDASDYDQIFHRFYRVDPSRSSSGCGMGLSYSRAVARAHGGNIDVSSVKGEYTEFVITLPLSGNNSVVPSSALTSVA